ncbi:MAG: hypothetical protein IH787_08880, partial [Nitrospirae bacterium]|nr:hypothetical protein [Nitrospirota bacterium]
AGVRMTQRRDSARQAWLRTTLDQYERPLVRYASGLLGNLDGARDVVQETFLRLCREDRARVDGHLSRWLFTVCRNHALDIRRKERRIETLGITSAASVERATAAPDDVAEKRETASEVLRILATLPDSDARTASRQVTTLCMTSAARPLPLASAPSKNLV